MIVGLTGGIGSGKTTALNCFKEFKNVAVYIADVEAKKLMNSSPVVREHNYTMPLVTKSFSDQDLQSVHSLAKLVFRDTAKTATAQCQIVHPEVAKHFTEFCQLMNKDKAYVLYENAILFETKNDHFCDCVITVCAALEARISRIIKRDATTRRQS